MMEEESYLFYSFFNEMYPGAASGNYSIFNVNSGYVNDSSLLELLSGGGAHKVGRIIAGFKLFYHPLVIFIGTLGNVLAILCILNSRLKANSIAQFILAYLCSNTLFLVSIIPSWLADFDVEVYHTDAWCQATYLFSSGSNFLSTWLMVCICMDRVFLINIPQSRFCRCCCNCLRLGDFRCSIFKAKVCIAIVSVLAVMVYFNMSLTVGVVDYTIAHACMPFHAVIPVYRVLNMIDICVNVALPYLLILVLGVVLAIGVRRVCIIRHRCNPSDSNFHCPRQQIQLTKSALTLMLCFILFNSPLQMIRIYHVIDDIQHVGYHLTAREVFWQELFQQLFHTSLALNVFVLLITCPGFRRACKGNLILLCKSLCWTNCKKQQKNATMRAFEFSYQFSYGLAQLQDTSLI